jgi:hypothetical protein
MPRSTQFQVNIGTIAEIFSPHRVHLLSGVGPVHMHQLCAPEAVTNIKYDNCYKLIGKFLSLKEVGMTAQMHCDRFLMWLFEHGVKHNRHSIVQCIAERAALMDPEIYLSMRPQV